MKSKKIQLKAEIKEFKLQKGIILLIDINQSKEILLLFILLKERLIDSLEVLLDNLSIYLTLDLNNNFSVCSLLNIKKRVFKATISMNLLEFAMSYLLKYYRDEVAEVEHIDLDFEYENNSTVTLIFKVDKSKEISMEEMNKLLGI